MEPWRRAESGNIISDDEEALDSAGGSGSASQHSPASGGVPPPTSTPSLSGLPVEDEQDTMEEFYEEGWDQALELYLQAALCPPGPALASGAPAGPPADITCGLCGQIDLDTYECRACGTRGCGFCVPANLCRSCSAVPVAAWTATQSEDGLPCRGLSRHRRRRTWQSLPSLMAKIAISDGNLCHH